jgi:hypothetical protein
MHDLERFGVSDIAACGAELRRIGTMADSMEDAADGFVRYLYDNLVEGTRGARACALVRFFKTHAYRDLDPGARDFARLVLGREPERATQCLTLLGTAGDESEWNSRAASAGHRAIPLTSEAVVDRFPMISQLIHQLGIRDDLFSNPDPGLLIESESRNITVFHVAEAVGSPHVPAQEEFVVRSGIRSVLGFGGVLPSGSLYVTILFSRVPISRETAGLFKTLAISIKMAVLPFDGVKVFAPGQRSGTPR